MINNGLRVNYVTPRSLRQIIRHYSQAHTRPRRHITSEGRTTSPEEAELSDIPRRSPFYFETGFSIFAKRPTRPFPPPYISYPAGSFSDPLTTYNRSHIRQAKIDGDLLRGITNGDDAILIGGQNFLAVNDGVGAWAQKERGHAALWSRLIAHYWAIETENAFLAFNPDEDVKLEEIKPIEYLDVAYARTKKATSSPHEILGTTTASSAILHHRDKDHPVVIATTLGDCAVFVVRPTLEEPLYKSTEQWHWFDCPRQLGTNSPDLPKVNAVTDIVDIQEGDIILCLSDGVTDNLWEHEISQKVSEATLKWLNKEIGTEDGVVFVARTLMNAAREVAQDPYGESPYMERALDEGIAADGGKLDDISVIVGICRKASE